jgi:hypothetical protein
MVINPSSDKEDPEGAAAVSGT